MSKMTWRRAVNRFLPVILSLAGVIVILSGIILIEGMMDTLIVAAGGILLLEIGVWYMSHPVLTDERHYLALRGEVNRFIDRVRQLKKAAVACGGEEELERLRAMMHESVEAMAKLVRDEADGTADVEEAPPLGYQAEPAAESPAGAPVNESVKLQ